MTKWRETNEDERGSVKARECGEGRPEQRDRGHRLSSQEIKALEQSELTIQPQRDYYVQGDVREIQKLVDAATRLESTDAGKLIAQAMKDHGTTVKFGHTRDNAIAQYNKDTNVVTIREQEKERSPEVLAAYLAHEGTHVQWQKDWGKDNSLDQEYHAHNKAVKVWNETKGDQKDQALDELSDSVARGENYTKILLLSSPTYRKLPDY